MRMRLKPLLEAIDGTEGLGVALAADRLPVDGCAICETIETQTLVKVGPHIWQLVSQPQGASVLDSISFDKAILVSS
jgi:cytochrome c2